MKIREMILDAKAKGYANEGKMWKSIDITSELLELIKTSHPQLYWSILRKYHALMYNCHYNQEWAEYDVSKLLWTDKDGSKHEGAHWTKDQIVAATANKKFPGGVTDWDKYVAYNAVYADLSKSFDEAQVLEAAFLLYFADEDWKPGKECVKIWEYMQLAQEA